MLYPEMCLHYNTSIHLLKCHIYYIYLYVDITQTAPLTDTY